MRRVLGPALALLAVLLTAVPAASAAVPVTARVVGGQDTTAGAVPWQVLVRPSGYLCGGSVLDATHVLTAAHCVYDPGSMTVTPPGQIQVFAGVTNRTSTAGGQSPAVTGVAVDPQYDPGRYTSDAAILTLAAPGFDLDNRADIDAIPLTTVGYRPTVSDNLRLSGWGTTVKRSPTSGANTDTPAVLLQKADTLHVSGQCATTYYGFDDAVQLCAGQADLDACQGDSGGPLAVQVGGVWQLAGIVSAGAGCAWEGYPGLYTRVANPHVHDFIASRGAGYAVSAPANTRAPALSGTATPGHALTCDPGTWTGASGSYGYTFVNDAEILAVSRSLTVTAADVGTNIRCVVTAYGLTDTVDATSAPVAVTDATARPVSSSIPEPAPAPAPQQQPTAPVGAAPDLVAPSAKVSARCSRTMCVLDVTVDDPTPSSGVAGVEARVSTAYRTTCGKGRKRRRCTKTVGRTLKGIVPVSRSRYRVKTPRLPKGTHTFTIVALDVAGHRQAKPTVLKKRFG
jgi:secreted trypsin-like serine protease